MVSESPPIAGGFWLTPLSICVTTSPTFLADPNQLEGEFMSYLRRGRSFCVQVQQNGGSVARSGPSLPSLLCLPLFSQTSQGTIQGGVFDQTGGAVAGAMVSVIDVARGVTRTLTTDGAGQYVATDLTPGTYTVRAEAKGFRTVEHSGVLVEVGQNIRVDLVVQPGEQTQTITVTGEIPAIDTTDATLGGTVSNEADQRAAPEWP